MLTLYYASVTVSSKPVQSLLIIIVGLYFIYFFYHNFQVLADFRALCTAWAMSEGHGSRYCSCGTLYVPRPSVSVLFAAPPFS